MGLWLKNEDGFVPVSGGGGAGGDAGPHDHDYLPLTGGTLTGKLEVGRGDELAPGLSVGGVKSGMWGGDGGVAISVNSVMKLDCKPDEVVVRDDLRVEGQASLKSTLDVVGETTIKGDLDVDGTLRANGNFTVPNGSVRLAGTVDGTRDVTTQPNIHVNSNGWMFRSTWKPSRMAFAPSKLTRDSDVLERAETATLPPEIETDDDGNVLNAAEIEAHDTVQLFDVVTALLLKIKELSAEIEELKAKDRPLKKEAAPRKRSAKKTTTAKKEDS
jgi:cytoskeletal protein CcmA (bactofilin family)